MWFMLGKMLDRGPVSSRVFLNSFEESFIRSVDETLQTLTEMEKAILFYCLIRLKTPLPISILFVMWKLFRRTYEETMCRIQSPISHLKFTRRRRTERKNVLTLTNCFQSAKEKWKNRLNER